MSFTSCRRALCHRWQPYPRRPTSVPAAPTTNPLSGEREVLVFEQGLWRQTVTERRIVEIDYDDAHVETQSRGYENRASRARPVKGVLLEETRTLESWFRDLSQPDLDPYLPLISKLQKNPSPSECCTANRASGYNSFTDLASRKHSERWYMRNPFGSPRVNGHRDYVIKAVLHGLNGPVDEKTYSDLMIPMGTNPDEWIASVASYVRTGFGNSASPVTAAREGEGPGNDAGDRDPACSGCGHVDRLIT